MDARPFRFEYDPPVLRYGAGCVDALGEELAAAGAERALVVCGKTVGATPAVIDPVREGLGDRLAGVFARTTPEKRLATAVAGRDALHDAGVDAVVAVGGGSSLDAAKLVSVLAAADRAPADVGRELAETGAVSVPDAPLVPVVVVPTTLAGADLSTAAGVTATPDAGLVDAPVQGGLSDPRLMPAAAFYDPALFATTPRQILASSAMNGFDKGIESLYASTATPVTDATAARGLGLLREHLPALGDGVPDEATLGRIVEGTILVQYGVSRPDETTLSVIHAFGHGISRTYDAQQGSAHAAVAPHVLRYVFDHADARREELAAALGASGGAIPEESQAAGAEGAGDPADAVVRAVADVAAELGLPTRLRDVDGPTPAEFPAVAETVLGDRLLANAPPGIDLDAEDVEEVLHAAW